MHQTLPSPPSTSGMTGLLLSLDGPVMSSLFYHSTIERQLTADIHSGNLKQIKNPAANPFATGLIKIHKIYKLSYGFICLSAYLLICFLHNLVQFSRSPFGLSWSFRRHAEAAEFAGYLWLVGIELEAAD